MKKILCVLIFVTLIAPVFAQTSQLLKHLPPSTEMIVALNPNEFFKKIPKASFEESFFYRDIIKNDKKGMKEFIENPSASGMDLSSDILFSIEPSSGGTIPGTIINVIGFIKNQKALTNMIIKMAGPEHPVISEGTNKIFMVNEFGAALAWNDEIFVITNGDQSLMRQELMTLWGNHEDSVSEEEMNKRMEGLKDKLAAITRSRCLQMLTANNSSAFISNIYVNKMLAEKADIRSWSNGAGFLQSFKTLSPAFAGLFGKLQSLTGSNKISFVNFENGKIRSVSHNYVNEDLAAVYKKFPPVTPNFDLAKKLPADTKILALMNVSSNPEMAKEMFRQSGLAALMDSVKEKLPFDPQLLNSTFGSRAMIAVMYMPESKMATIDDLSATKKNPFGGLQILIALPISNPSNFKELSSSIQQALSSWREKRAKHKEDNDGEEVKKEMFDEMLNDVKISMQHNDSLCVISGSSKLIENYMNNPGTTRVPAWLQASSQYPMTMAFSLGDFMNSLYENAGRPSSPKDLEMKNFIDQLKNVVIAGGDFSDGAIHNRTEFTLGDPNKNALLQLFELFNTVGKSGMRDRETLSEERKVEQEGIKMTTPEAEKTTTPSLKPAKPQKTKGKN